MKSKQAVSTKKQAIIVKDLKTRKNPKGGSADIYLKLEGTPNLKTNPHGAPGIPLGTFKL